MKQVLKKSSFFKQVDDNFLIQLHTTIKTLKKENV